MTGYSMTDPLRSGQVTVTPIASHGSGHGRASVGLISQIHATSHMFRFCIFQAFGRVSVCCHCNSQVSKELGITILWVIKHWFECKALKPSIAMTRERSNNGARDAERLPQ